LSIPTASVASNVNPVYGTGVLLLPPPPYVISLPLLSTPLVVTTSGSVVSCTVIVKDSSEGLPAASYALHVTTVSFIGNVSPEL
jgi:hypothetical protein